MTVRQASFDDLQQEEEARRLVRKLTPKQLDIITFLDQGFYQSYIAKRLKISRTYVNQTVSLLLKYQLIKQQTISPLQKKSLTYELTKKLRAYLQQNEIPSSNYTLCIPHHIKFKYSILETKGQITKEGWKFSKFRSIFIRSWLPKGLERYLFHVNLAENTIGIEVQFGKTKSSIIAYRIEHTKVIAQTIEEATAIIATEIGKGVETFIREQSELGFKVQIGQPKQIDKTHFAFESEIAKEVFQAGGQSQLEGVYLDDSLKNQGNQTNAAHIETRDPILANKIDKGLTNAINIDSIVKREIGAAMPQALAEFNKTLEPLNENMSQVMAMLQGSITLEQQNSNILKYLSQIMTEMQEIRLENRELRAKIGT